MAYSLADYLPGRNLAPPQAPTSTGMSGWDTQYNKQRNWFTGRLSEAMQTGDAGAVARWQQELSNLDQQNAKMYGNAQQGFQNQLQSYGQGLQNFAADSQVNMGLADQAENTRQFDINAQLQRDQFGQQQQQSAYDNMQHNKDREQQRYMQQMQQWNQRNQMGGQRDPNRTGQANPSMQYQKQADALLNRQNRTYNPQSGQYDINWQPGAQNQYQSMLDMLMGSFGGR